MNKEQQQAIHVLIYKCTEFALNKYVAFEAIVTLFWKIASKMASEYVGPASANKLSRVSPAMATPVPHAQKGICLRSAKSLPLGPPGSIKASQTGVSAPSSSVLTPLWDVMSVST